MLVVGELINKSRKAVAVAIEIKDATYIQAIAKKQVEAGADYIDINAGVRGVDEPEVLAWLVGTVQKVVDVPICLDSWNPKALTAALKVHKGQALINSITAEKKMFDDLVGLTLEYDTKAIALCLDETGMCKSVNQRLEMVDILSNKLVMAGVKLENIFFDPLVKPVSVNNDFAKEVLLTIRAINQHFPEVHTICGISNVSFGLPRRKMHNQAFLLMCLANGMDSVILNPLDEDLMSLLAAAKTLLGVQ